MDTENTEKTACAVPRLALIWAAARGGAIGRAGTLPWQLPEDLAHFRRLTLGCPVIMGRRTWAGLPARFRPLPGRRNIVLTRRSHWAADGAECAASLHDALRLAAGAALAWCIGGAQTYAQALPLADEIHATEIELDVPDADAFAPTLGADWRETQRSTHTAANGLRYHLVRYEKIDKGIFAQPAEYAGIYQSRL